MGNLAVRQALLYCGSPLARRVLPACWSRERNKPWSDKKRSSSPRDFHYPFDTTQPSSIPLASTCFRLRIPHIRPQVLVGISPPPTRAIDRLRFFPRPSAQRPNERQAPSRAGQSLLGGGMQLVRSEGYARDQRHSLRLRHGSNVIVAHIDN